MTEPTRGAVRTQHVRKGAQQCKRNQFELFFFSRRLVDVVLLKKKKKKKAFFWTRSAAKKRRTPYHAFRRDPDRTRVSYRASRHNKAYSTPVR